MEQRATHKITSSTWHRELVPHAEEYIREITTRKEHLLIRQSSFHRAEVESLHCRHIVDIETKECTCNVWKLTGLPCIHAIAFIGKKEHPLWHTYVNDYYYIYRYRLSYDGAIAMLPGKDQWQVVQDLVEVGAPNTSRPRGRPKRRRLPIFWKRKEKFTNVADVDFWVIIEVHARIH
ncbi:ubiquitin-conjugating enzyme E2 S [Dendrobium catenatum]|uniref:Ubiquitin-conjugating enzyme E2 S n=1 Tax=Dendrobium catenatum TaxID=906689 RepID=A0A2I0XCJ2_9ASPA|nr:ubiquitin-conjugating enzyme E2 S [Dendrobium catenatum]